MNFKHLALAAVLAVCPAAVLAQTVPTPVTTTPATKRATIQQRKENQQDRIAHGVKDGQIKAGETARLEHQQAGINKEERGMRAQDKGHLTTQDRKTLNRQQNVESKRIHRDTHNARKQ